MIFDIASFKIKVLGKPRKIFDFPESFYKKFHQYLCSNSRSPCIDFTLVVIPFESFSLPSKSLEKRQQHLYNENKEKFIIKSPGAIASVNMASKTISLGFKGKVTNRRKNLILMGFVRLAVSICAVLKGGLPFHSSVIAFNKYGIAFSGPSGAGKTTIAKLLAAPGQLLNDEFNVILPLGKNGYRIHSTPFTQFKTLKSCNKKNLILHTIFFLEKSMANSIENLAFKNKYISLLGQTYIFPLSDFFGKKILDNAEKICGNVSCKRLHFKNDETVRSFIYDFAKDLL